MIYPFFCFLKETSSSWLSSGIFSPPLPSSTNHLRPSYSKGSFFSISHAHSHSAHHHHAIIIIIFDTIFLSSSLPHLPHSPLCLINLPSFLRSNLGAMFGGEQQGGADLTYTRPSEPAEAAGGAAAATANAAPTMQHAVAASVYQFVNNAYESKGKLGVAIIGYFGKKDYKVIVYNNKKAQLMQATLHAEFSYTPQPGNYASLYDDARANW